MRKKLASAARFFLSVDLALAQAVAQLVYGDVDVDHFIGTLEKTVGNRFADDGIGRAVRRRH